MNSSNISLKEYCPRAKLLHREDIIKDLVNREAEWIVPDQVVPELEENLVRKFSWSKAVKYAFSREIVLGLLP